jgi:serine/threonine protein kinase
MEQALIGPSHRSRDRLTCAVHWLTGPVSSKTAVPPQTAKATMGDRLPDIPGYNVEAELGRGGMGIVYHVRRRNDGAVLALKMLLRSRGASLAELARFRIEAEALACLNHPNIVKIRDVGLYAGYPFFAMDFAERGSLKQAVTHGPQRPVWAAEVVRTLALAMQHAHERGMLHRDLKPANVLLRGDGTAIITDFGLVKFANPVREVSEMWCTRRVSLLDAELTRFAQELSSQYSSVADAPAAIEDVLTRSLWEQCATRTGVLGDGTRLEAVREFLNDARQQSEQFEPNLDGLTEAGAVMGSPNYMAPEQARGQLDRIGPHTDVYALGGILYELLTGRPPFHSGSLVDLLRQVCSTPPVRPRQLVPAVSGDIEAVCLRCLEKPLDSRYQTAGALAEDLSQFLDGYTPK